jgi:transposase
MGARRRPVDPPGRRGAPAVIPRRQMVDAMLFIGRTGCQWRHLPERYGAWTAVWAQWRRWRANGVWAAAMARLAAIVRVLHNREPVPSMVMVDAQTVKGGRYGPTFHAAGGRGGRTIGTKRTLLVEILGLPVAAAACSARPHDVVAGRDLLRDRIDSCRASGRSSAIARTAASRVSLAAGTSRLTSRRRLQASAASSQSGRSTRSSTHSPSSDAGGASAAATRAAKRPPGPGSRWPRSATSPGARPPEWFSATVRAFIQPQARPPRTPFDTRGSVSPSNRPLTSSSPVSMRERTPPSPKPARHSGHRRSGVQASRAHPRRGERAAWRRLWPGPRVRRRPNRTSR